MYNIKYMTAIKLEYKYHIVPKIINEYLIQNPW